MAAMASPKMQPWTPRDLALVFAMWAIMMVAMMTPAATPMILLFATIHRKRRERAAPYVPTAVFLLGYLLVWTLFSAGATLAQWGLHAAALLTPAMAVGSALAGGAILVAAGLYQWLPLKDACLNRCRTPLDFLLAEWREGLHGAVAMGMRHGVFCLGCCGLLMAILFVAGVMNLFWVAGIAAFVLLEKTVPAGRWVGRLAGLALLAWGLRVCLGPWL